MVHRQFDRLLLDPAKGTHKWKHTSSYAVLNGWGMPKANHMYIWLTSPIHLQELYPGVGALLKSHNHIYQLIGCIREVPQFPLPMRELVDAIITLRMRSISHKVLAMFSECKPFPPYVFLKLQWYIALFSGCLQACTVTKVEGLSQEESSQSYILILANLLEIYMHNSYSYQQMFAFPFGCGRALWLHPNIYKMQFLYSSYNLPTITRNKNKCRAFAQDFIMLRLLNLCFQKIFLFASSKMTFS